MTLDKVLTKDLENRLDEIKYFIQTHKATTISDEEKAVLSEMIVRLEYNVRSRFDLKSSIYLTAEAKVIKEMCNPLEVKKIEM